MATATSAHAAGEHDDDLSVAGDPATQRSTSTATAAAGEKRRARDNEVSAPGSGANRRVRFKLDDTNKSALREWGSWAPCINAKFGCPCPASYSGDAGESCCRSCKPHNVCKRAYHKQPFPPHLNKFKPRPATAPLPLPRGGAVSSQRTRVQRQPADPLIAAPAPGLSLELIAKIRDASVRHAAFDTPRPLRQLLPENIRSLIVFTADIYAGGGGTTLGVMLSNTPTRLAFVVEGCITAADTLSRAFGCPQIWINNDGLWDARILMPGGWQTVHPFGSAVWNSFPHPVIVMNTANVQAR